MVVLQVFFQSMRSFILNSIYKSGITLKIILSLLLFSGCDIMRGEMRHYSLNKESFELRCFDSAIKGVKSLKVTKGPFSGDHYYYWYIDLIDVPEDRNSADIRVFKPRNTWKGEISMNMSFFDINREPPKVHQKIASKVFDEVEKSISTKCKVQLKKED